MIDIFRAFHLAWQRMTVILFQPLDGGKWFILGFNAFLVMMAEGDIQFNQPISFTAQKQPPWMGQSLPAVIHGSKEWLESLRALAEGPSILWYAFIAIAYLIGWLVLSWVGSRGQFLFLDNIVRNRAAIAEPWHRYAREGNLWFLFNLLLSFFTTILMVLSVGLFLLVSWAWISQERSPQGAELAALAFFMCAFALFWIVAGSVLFILRSFAIPLLFKQTYGLGSALGAVIHLIFSQPLGVLVFLLASVALGFAGALITFMIGCLICCFIFWLGFIPIIGSLLMTAVLAQLLLPLLVFYRCFQIDCLSQFGPAYDIWSVDVPPAATN
jgi:hypothetical protein